MKKFLFILGLLFFFPVLVRADYCEKVDLTNVYQDAYCDLRLDENVKAEEMIYKNIAIQLGYDEGLTTWLLSQGEVGGELNLTSCEGIKKYMKENDLQMKDLHPDFKQACLHEGGDENAPFTGEAYSLTSVQNIYTRLQNAYLKESAFYMNKNRLEKTFKASERYWDGRIEIGTPFDLMVDLNIMDQILFGSHSKWVNDVFAFSKGQDLIEKKEDAPLAQDPPSQVNEEQNQEPQVTPVDEGMNLNLGDSSFLHPDCLTPAPQAPALCGNGTIDLLEGEVCDDGNQVDGDGCNRWCQKTGGSFECKDPGAITFYQFSDLPQGEGNATLCPPVVSVSSPNSESPPEISDILTEEQTDSLPVASPVPFVGGTLTPLPVAESPACPEGKSKLQVTVGPGGEGKEASTACIPSEFCGDFNKIREALYGPDWASGPNAELAAAIETAVCVNFTTQNRPLNPYSPNEGCIDCHFRAMADALEQVLSSNVTPLVNTTSAFALSNRWGPNFSFDLNVSVKKIPAIPQKSGSTQKTDEEKANFENIHEQAHSSSQAGESSLNAIEETAFEAISREITEAKNNLDEVTQDLETHQTLASSLSDLAFSQQVIPQINSLTSSFSAIQNDLVSISFSSKALSEKKQCSL